jgi:hypothetical protein
MCRRMALRRNPELISRSRIFWEREDGLERGVLGLAVIGNCYRCAGKLILRKGFLTRGLM